MSDDLTRLNLLKEYLTGSYYLLDKCLKKEELISMCQAIPNKQLEDILFRLSSLRREIVSFMQEIEVTECANKPLVELVFREG